MLWPVMSVNLCVFMVAFTQQGLQKYTDMITKEYFLATCHRNDEALIQIVQKQNRLELSTSVTVGLWLQSALKLDVLTVPKLVTTS